MYRRSQLKHTQLLDRAETLLNAASNRYRITVQVANQAKRDRPKDYQILDGPEMKPVIRAIVEMSEELMQLDDMRDDCPHGSLAWDKKLK